MNKAIKWLIWPMVVVGLLPLEVSKATEILQEMEVDITQYDLKGTIGNYPVTVSLVRAGDRVDGSYTYDNHKYGALSLQGRIDKHSDHMQLSELTASEKRNTWTSGHWDIALSPSGGHGEWVSGKQHLPVTLQVDPLRPALPFQMKVRVRMPDNMNWFAGPESGAHNNCDGSHPYVTNRIQLYRNGKLLQQLDGGPWTGACAPMFPKVVDVNFDGHADLLLPRAEGYSAEHYYDYWEYRPVTGRFEHSSELDQIFTGWDDPDFDPMSKTIVMDYPSMGTSNFLTVWYAWRNGHLIVVKRRDCDYYVPESDKNANTVCKTSTENL